MLSEIRRIDGVGRAQLFATQRAMRIWIDPDKMVGLDLTADDVTAAIRSQNAQVAAGRIGALPNPIGQQISATVLVRGQLTSRRGVRLDRAARQSRRLGRAAVATWRASSSAPRTMTSRPG